MKSPLVPWILILAALVLFVLASLDTVLGLPRFAGIGLFTVGGGLLLVAYLLFQRAACHSGDVARRPQRVRSYLPLIVSAFAVIVVSALFLSQLFFSSGLSPAQALVTLLVTGAVAFTLVRLYKRRTPKA